MWLRTCHVFFCKKKKNRNKITKKKVLVCVLKFGAHEMIIPHAALRDEEKTQENVTQQELGALPVLRFVPAGTWVGQVFVRFSPLKPARRQFVRRETTRTGGETTGANHRLVRRPRLVLAQNPRVGL